MSKQKIIYFVLLALVAIFSFLSWQSLGNLLYQVGGRPVSLILPSVSFLFLGATLGLLVLLFDSLIFLAAAFLIAFCLSLVFFGLKWVFLIALFIGSGATILASQRATREKRFRIKIIVREITKPALDIIFIVFALLIALTLYFSPPAQNLSVELKIPRSLFDLVLNSMVGILSGEIKGQPAPSFLNIPGLPGITLKDIQRSLGGQENLLDINKILNQESRDNLYQLTNQQLNFFLQPYKRYLPYGLAVAIFFALIAIKFIFVWLAMAIIQGVFGVMKRLKLVNIKKEMVEKEIIEISN